MNKIKVGILGATGSVGQKFIEQLQDHPWFEISNLCASKTSAGKKYFEAVKGRWKIQSKIPENIKIIRNINKLWDCHKTNLLEGGCLRTSETVSAAPCNTACPYRKLGSN